MKESFKGLSTPTKVWAGFLILCLLAPAAFFVNITDHTSALFYIRNFLGGFGTFMWICVLLIAAAADGNP
jgi:hypothetical protein